MNTLVAQTLMHNLGSREQTPSAPSAPSENGLPSVKGQMADLSVRVAALADHLDQILADLRGGRPPERVDPISTRSEDRCGGVVGDMLEIIDHTRNAVARLEDLVSELRSLT